MKNEEKNIKVARIYIYFTPTSKSSYKIKTYVELKKADVSPFVGILFFIHRCLREQDLL